MQIFPFERGNYPIYNHPNVEKALKTIAGTLKFSIYIFATWYLFRHVGLWWTAGFLFVYFTVDAASKETIYAHSDLGLGPGRLATLQENIAQGIRHMLVLVGISWALDKLVASLM